MQTTKSMTEIVKELRDQDFYKRQPLTSDPDEEVHVAIALYPTEVVKAAQKGLGLKALSEYYVDIYEFAQECQAHNKAIKKSQLSGVLLTHQKIAKWLAKNSIDDVFALHDPVVLRIYLIYHINNLEATVAMFERIAVAIS